MIIDSAIHDFITKYDREAIQSIDELSKDKSGKLNKIKYKLFNLTESFDKFKILIDNWGKYQIKILTESTNFTEEQAQDEVDDYIDKLVKDKDINSEELSSFIESYLIGIKDITNLINSTKARMLDENVNQESTTFINEISDRFMKIINSKMDESMDKLLMASGYTTKKRLSEDYITEKKMDNFII